MSLLILEAIELLNIIRKLPSDKQAADELNSVFEEMVSVIISPSLDLNKTIKVNPIRKVDNKHTGVGIVIKKKKKHAKKQTISSTNICESAVSVSDLHINLKENMGSKV